MHHVLVQKNLHLLAYCIHVTVVSGYACKYRTCNMHSMHIQRCCLRIPSFIHDVQKSFHAYRPDEPNSVDIKKVRREA